LERQIPCPATVAVAKEAILALRLVEEASVLKELVDVTDPCRLTEKTVDPRSLIPRIKKSFAFEVPFDLTSRAERVPVAALLSVWLMVNRVCPPEAVLEAYMPCSCLALNA